MDDAYFTTVPRPTRSFSAVNDQDRLEAVLATADNGQAICIPLHGERVESFKSRWASRLRDRGYRLRTRSKGDAIVVWAVRQTGPVRRRLECRVTEVPDAVPH